MTRPTIAVAPREITDLAFRACRVDGCDPSVADRIARDVTQCELHRGCGVARLAALLADGSVVETFLSTQHAQFDADRFACGVECDGTDSAQAVDLDRERAALANGVGVDATAWADLEDTASRFVLSEAIIDAADTPTG